MTAWGPVATWRQARRTCTPGCFGYHATWPLVRTLGLKASPRWHADHYRTALATLRPADGQPLRVLVAGAADHVAVATLAAVADSHPLVLHVVDRCPTPLAAIDAWAAHHHVTATTQLGRIEDLDASSEPYDAVACDGLLSLLADPEARSHVLGRVAAALAPTGLLIYTTRLTVGGRPLEYDIAGRILQTAASAAWPHPTRDRLHVALDRWRRPARSAPYTAVDQLRTELASHFAAVTVDVDPTPPTTALRCHPRHMLHRAGTHVVRATAMSPTGTP